MSGRSTPERRPLSHDVYVWDDGDETRADASPLEWLRSFGGFLLWLAGLRPLDGGDGRP